MLDILMVQLKADKEPTAWYFERGVDDEPVEFNKAKQLAQELGIYAGELDSDIITDYDEFENWARSVAAPPEDDLTRELRQYMVALDDYNKVSKQYERIAQERATLSNALSDFNKGLAPKLRDKIKIVDGRSFTGRHNGYSVSIIELGQA